MSKRNKILAALGTVVFLVPWFSLAQTMTAAEVQEEIKDLLAEVQVLEAQLLAQGGTASWCHVFSENLFIGISGTDVTALQTALQKDGESVSTTGIFDDQTAAAVTGFQEKYASSILAPYGLAYGTGYAGNATRIKLNALFGCASGAVTATTSTLPIACPGGSGTPGNCGTLPIGVATGTLPSSTFPIICPAWGCHGPEPISVLSPASTTTSSIAVTSPSGGETWTIGSVHQITWQSRGTSGPYQVYLNGLSANGSSTLTELASDIPSGTNYFTWVIPSGLAEGSYGIEIISSGTGISVTSAPFNVVNPASGKSSFTVSSNTVLPGGSLTFSWSGFIPLAGSVNNFVTIGCPSGVTMFDVTNNGAFTCGAVGRAASSSGSDTISFATVNVSSTQVTFGISNDAGQSLGQTITVQSVNDTEAAEESRDTIRVSDLATLRSAIALYSEDSVRPNFACADKKTIYASASITPPAGWKTGINMGSTAIDGTGWLPVNFASISSGAPIGRLPVDPSNDPGRRLVYLFACDPSVRTYELDAVLESQKYNRGGSGDSVSTDGGNDPYVYETGTDMTLIPNDFWGQ